MSRGSGYRVAGSYGRRFKLRCCAGDCQARSVPPEAEHRSGVRQVTRALSMGCFLALAVYF